jgi:hypothetical protein
MTLRTLYNNLRPLIKVCLGVESIFRFMNCLSFQRYAPNLLEEGEKIA